MHPVARVGLAAVGTLGIGAAFVMIRGGRDVPAMRPDPVTSVSASQSASAPVSASVAPAPSPSAPLYDRKVEYEKNLAEAKNFKGTPCHGLATWVVPGRLAALVRYACELPTTGEDDWSHREGVRWVGAAPGEVIDHRDTYAEVVWAAKGGLWDLRGEGAAYGVVWGTGAAPYWAHKEWGYDVFRLEGDRWVEEKVVPHYPDEGEDVDHDGVPEFPFELVVMRDYDACSELADGRYTRRYSVERLTVEGLERWNGTGYSTEFASFRPWYAARLREARADAAAWVTPSESGDAAPSDAAPSDAAVPVHCRTDRVLQIAMRIDVYARVLGSAPATVKSEVDRFLTAAGDAKASELWSKGALDGTVPVLP
jgi:hypothetical protein